MRTMNGKHSSMNKNVIIRLKNISNEQRQKLKFGYIKGIAPLSEPDIKHVFKNLEMYTKEFIYDDKTDMPLKLHFQNI